MKIEQVPEATSPNNGLLTTKYTRVQRAVEPSAVTVNVEGEAKAPVRLAKLKSVKQVTGPHLTARVAGEPLVTR